MINLHQKTEIVHTPRYQETQPGKQLPSLRAEMQRQRRGKCDTVRLNVPSAFLKPECFSQPYTHKYCITHFSFDIVLRNILRSIITHNYQSSPQPLKRTRLKADLESIFSGFNVIEKPNQDNRFNFGSLSPSPLPQS